MHWNTAATAKSLQSCPTLSNPMDCSPPGSSVHGIFQERVLEWGTIAFFDWNTTQHQKRNESCNNIDKSQNVILNERSQTPNSM